MKKNPKVINSEPFSHSGINYDFLLEKGLEWVQRYSGDIWTDYNYHDPGVTFLEQLVFALTDLGYRTSFEIQDLLMVGKDEYPLFEKNLFFPPQEILPINPVNILDFRKLIIDRIKEVDNAWVIPVKDDPSGFKGLYNILLQCAEDISEKQRNDVKIKVTNLYQEHRNLCHDLKSVKILNEEIITFSGQIVLKSDAIGEQVFASILNAIDQYLAPAIMFYHPEELLENGWPIETVYDGPKPLFGYLNPNQLPERKDVIFIAEIKEIILKVDGVQSVSDLEVYKNGIKCFEDNIAFDEGGYPVLGNLNSFLENNNARLQFYKDQIRYSIDIITATQLYESLASGRKSSYQNAIKYNTNLASGDFSFDELSAFYSIQQELPELFGLKAESLPSNISPRRMAQVKQLKAYLSIFDQIMANYLSQMANIRRILSIERTLDKTYFYQYPNDIPEFDQVIVGRNIDDYLRTLGEITEDEETFWKRRNKILNHLLARFGERYISLPGMSSRQMVKAKINVLENFVWTSRNRGKGFNYWTTEEDLNNISGIERKLILVLDLKVQNASLIEPLLEFGKIEEDQEKIKNWEKVEIETKDGNTIETWRLPESEYEEDSLSFYTQTENFIGQLFLRGILDRYYKLLETKSEEFKWNILYTGLDYEIPITTYLASDINDAKEIIKKSIQKFVALNKACEGLHLLEHILLRPVENIKYQFTLFDREGGVLMTSYYTTDLKQQKQLIDDVIYLGLKKENYGIVEGKDKNQFEIVLYGSNNELVGRFEKTFYSRIGAEKEVERGIALFQEIIDGSFVKEEAIEINQVNGIAHAFPQSFGFEDEYSIILPNWPAKFQNDDFKNLLVNQLAESNPIHLKVNLYFIGIRKMMEFEDAFFGWKNQKQTKPQNPVDLDKAALRLVQTLQGLKGNKMEV